MSLNHREIDLILEELDLTGARIQKIRQPDFKSMVFDIYKKEGLFRLYISLAHGKTRLHSIKSKVEYPQTLQRFAQFLRSRITSGKITEASQPGGNRIVKIAVKQDEDITILWIRLWGGASNIIATAEDLTILDAFYRRPGRGEISGGKFMLPDDQPVKNREYNVREFPGKGSFNERVEAYYSEDESRKSAENLREKALNLIVKRETTVISAIESMRKQIKSYEEPDRYKVWADLILSNSHSIFSGSSYAEVENFFSSGELVRIELDASRSPEKNAQHYYELYRKAKAGFEALSEELEAAEKKLASILELKSEIQCTEDRNFLDSIVRKESKKENRIKQNTGSGLYFISGEHTVIVGRSARENDELLRSAVRGNDYWLHARDYAGSYVFVKYRSGKSIPLDTLLDAGNLALFYSKGRTSGEADLYYTQVKYLRRAKYGKKGLVIPTREKTLHITIDRARINRLFSGMEPDV